MGEREKHLRQLASELDVKLIIRRGCWGDPEGWFVGRNLLDQVGGTFNDRESGEVWTEPGIVLGRFNPRTPYAYFVGLHELGHAADPELTVRRFDTPDRIIVAEEVRAWEWAFENSRERASKSTLAKIFDDPSRSLGSYTHYNGNYDLTLPLRDKVFA